MLCYSLVHLLQRFIRRLFTDALKPFIPLYRFQQFPRRRDRRDRVLHPDLLPFVLMKRFSKAPFLFLSRLSGVRCFRGQKPNTFFGRRFRVPFPASSSWAKESFCGSFRRARFGSARLDDAHNGLEYSRKIPSSFCLNWICAGKNRVPSSFSTKANADAENTTNTNTTNKASLFARALSL